MVKKEIMYHTNFATSKELFKGATDFLVSKGFATEEFAQALEEREERFPTGLPTRPASAIPHSDGTYAKEDVLLCISNETPISFFEMGSKKERSVEVKIIFILLVKDKVTHLEQLQRLIERTKDAAFLVNLQEADSAADFKQIFETSF